MRSKHQRLVFCEHGAKRVPYTVEARVRLHQRSGKPITFYVIIARCLFGYHYLAPKIAAFQQPDGVFDGGEVVVEEFARDIDDAHQWASEAEATHALEAWDAMMQRRAEGRE